MTRYNITAERANGTKFTDIIYAADEKKARRDFNVIYRHADKPKIVSIEALGDGYTASKAQEREALAEIHNIIYALGKDSYIAPAFKGCIEYAVENIENDWTLSMYDSWQTAEAKISALEAEVANLKYKLEESKKDYEAAHATAHEIAEEKDAEIASLKEQLSNTIKHDDLDDVIALAKSALYDAESDIKKHSAEIVELADNPDSVQFRDAVHRHRQSKERYDHYFKLINRLCDIKPAGN